ncbi:MAG: hypothetical protein CMJ48_13230 [Planctomycetaceae bacterium]|nr:hypothetical protein [Planctomycetaceae bacterium]
MDYHLKPIGRNCAGTGEPLVPGSFCHSVVREIDGHLVRFDFSAESWEGPPDDAIAQWQCLVPEGRDDKPKPLDTEALFRYFEQLCEDASPARNEFRYILALMLLQKRRLKLEGSRFEDDAEFLELIGSHGEGPFEVPDQQLEDTEIEQLQQDLNSHITAEWS